MLHYFIPAEALVTMDPISTVEEGNDVMVCINLICSPGSILDCPLNVTVDIDSSTKAG